MIKFISLMVSSLVFSSPVMAKSLNCEVVEFVNGENTIQKLVVESQAGDPHGGLLTFKGQVFPELSGFVSLLENDKKYFAVLSVYSEKLDTNSSSQNQMVIDGQYAQLQFIIPNDSLKLAGIQILCQYFE